MRIPLLTLLLSATCCASAQRVIDITNNDVDAAHLEQMQGFIGGSIFPADKYVKVKEGTPFYLTDWSPGSLVMENGTTFQNLQLKLDLLNHEIHYKDADSREMIVTSPIRRLIIRPGLDARMFIPGKPWAAVDKTLADAWLQVLVNDSVSLLLQIRKKVTESTPYASSTAEQTIEDKEIYFLQKDGQLLHVSRWSDLFNLLGDKKTDLTRYAKENHLTGDAPVEYAQLVAYYNKL
jgi:hypothetical protein